MTEQNPERKFRLEKIEKLKEMGINPYPERFDKKNDLTDIFTLKEGDKVKSAGRILTFREMGKIAFAHLQDFSGKVQVVFMQDELGKESFRQLLKLTDLGDFLGVEGEVYVTKKGETSILVKNWTFLGKALLPLPEKFHGLKDVELIYRQRYLDLIANEDSKQRFILRSKLLKTIREFYWQEGFVEVETPVLMHKATGALAKPYQTHNDAWDLDLVLRIALELPLKELIVGGYEKVFECGKVFRNEGQDPSHLPEHTSIEHYVAYWNFEDNIVFTEKMFDHIFNTLNLDRKIKVKDREGNWQEIDFSTPWQRVDYLELVNKDSGLDVLSYDTPQKLSQDLKAKGIEFENMDQMSLANLIDNVYKKLSRPKIVNPTILYNYPKVLKPLARKNDNNPQIADAFQLVVNGWEIINAYSELVDPIDQKERFIEQAKAKSLGDEEAMDIDEDYLVAMEHGMPPISGWGLGFDRLVTLLTAQDNLRDVVLFPMVKPKDR